MGHAWSKTKLLSQILEKPCVCSRGHILSPIIMKPGPNVVLMKAWTSLKIDHVGSKTMSLVHILRKHCVRSKGHIFCPIIMKPIQNICLDKISDNIENGSRQVKN